MCLESEDYNHLSFKQQNFAMNTSSEETYDFCPKEIETVPCTSLIYEEAIQNTREKDMEHSYIDVIDNDKAVDIEVVQPVECWTQIAFSWYVHWILEWEGKNVKKHRNVYIAIRINIKKVNFNIILIDGCKFENKNKVFTTFIVNCTHIRNSMNHKHNVIRDDRGNLVLIMMLRTASVKNNEMPRSLYQKFFFLHKVKKCLGVKF